MTKTSLHRFEIMYFGHCDLPFDLSQGGELVEPFVIWVLLFGIFITSYHLNGCTNSLRTLIINAGSSPEPAASTRTARALTQERASNTTR
jgi:hypothetical protein